MSNADGQLVSKLCSFRRFPNHTQRRHRNECGQCLMKTVRCANGKVSLYPRLIYCYKSIIESLKEMVAKPGFVERCELWRQRKKVPDVYRDVYDGNAWKDFMVVDGMQFLSVPFNYAFHFNVDWFQPFKHTQHSEGAIYISILNLPKGAFSKGKYNTSWCNTWA